MEVVILPDYSHFKGLPTSALAPLHPCTSYEKRWFRWPSPWRRSSRHSLLSRWLPCACESSRCRQQPGLQNTLSPSPASQTSAFFNPRLEAPRAVKGWFLLCCLAWLALAALATSLLLCRGKAFHHLSSEVNACLQRVAIVS